MYAPVSAILLSVALFLGMIACTELGYRIGRRGLDPNGQAPVGIGVIDAAVFGMVGLLLAFAFAGGMSRLDARRQLIAQEANAISTAYLRLDTLPPDEQPAVRHLFREYVSARLRVHDALFTSEIANRERAQATRWQQQIWEKAVALNRADPAVSTTWLVLPALNDMFDIASSRTIAERTHLPGIILALLLFAALLSAFLSGFGMASGRRRALLHTVLYAAVVSVTVYVILDLDYPRAGLIRLDAAQEMIRRLRDGMP